MSTRKKWLKRRDKKDRGPVFRINAEVVRYAKYWNARSDADKQGLAVGKRRRRSMDRQILKQVYALMNSEDKTGTK